MKWYYVENGNQAGPVEETEFAQLLQSGKLTGGTLVWHEGMANWEPFSAVCPPAFAAMVVAPPIAGGGPVATQAEAACAECGSVFNKDEMIPHGNVFICARCKPVFMQKLAEGATISTGALNYATVGARFGALFIDGVLLWIVNFVISLTFGLTARQAVGTAPVGFVAVQIMLFLLQIGIGLAYDVILVGKYGATLGKMACKIKIVTADGGRVTYLRALGRHFAKLLSGMMCLIGYIMAIFDKEERRALHDRMCNTRVVYK